MHRYILYISSRHTFYQYIYTNNEQARSLHHHRTAYLEDEKINSYFFSAFFPNSVINCLLQYLVQGVHCTTAIV
jgi:hypothetical protein